MCPVGGLEPALRHVGDHRGDEGVAEPARDELGQELDARIVLAQRHVRPVLLRPPDRHDDRGLARAHEVAHLRPRQLLEEDGVRGLGGRSGRAGQRQAQHGRRGRCRSDGRSLARGGVIPSRDGCHHKPDPPFRDLQSRAGAKGWTKKPLRSLGANHVLFGGMMAPASATAMSCCHRRGVHGDGERGLAGVHARLERRRPAALPPTKSSRGSVA